MENQHCESSFRSFVGPEEKYDLFSAVQFNLLTNLGLREYHSLLDIGCGSLRAGRLFIPYLLRGRYFGIEPQEWLVKEGISKQLGQDMIDLKRPSFVFDDNFSLTRFEQKFDFLLAHSIFSHATQAQVRRCMEEAAKVMDDTSLFAATFVEGEKDYTGDKWTIWVEYTFDFIKRTALEQGLSVRRLDWPSPDLQQWILITKPGNMTFQQEMDTSVALMNALKELDFCREKLARLENNPVMALALKMNRSVKWLNFYVSSIWRNIKGQK